MITSSTHFVLVYRSYQIYVKDHVAVTGESYYYKLTHKCLYFTYKPENWETEKQI